MVDYDKLYYTDIYNWTILSDGSRNQKCYIIYARGYKDWMTFSYYPDDRLLNLNGIKSYCNSFDKANKLVRGVLKVYKHELHDRYKGRYFKLKKIMKDG